MIGCQAAGWKSTNFATSRGPEVRATSPQRRPKDTTPEIGVTMQQQQTQRGKYYMVNWAILGFRSFKKLATVFTKPLKRIRFGSRVLTWPMLQKKSQIWCHFATLFFQLQVLRLSLQMLGGSELILGQIHLTSQGLCRARDKHVTLLCASSAESEYVHNMSQTFEYIFRKQVVRSRGSNFLGSFQFLEHLQTGKSGKKLTANIDYVHLWSKRKSPKTSVQNGACFGRLFQL